MKLLITILYRDDKKEEFHCVDFPSLSKFITLYLEDFKKVYIPDECVARITQEFK